MTVGAPHGSRSERTQLGTVRHSGTRSSARRDAEASLVPHKDGGAVLAVQLPSLVLTVIVGDVVPRQLSRLATCA